MTVFALIATLAAALVSDFFSILTSAVDSAFLAADFFEVLLWTI